MANCPTCGASVAADARFCPNCGSALGAPAPEERKLATILFADVIGSTDLGEQLDPERLNAVLQEYFAAMARLIEQWGGTVEKYIGDAVVAAFGVPTSREDDPIRALRAATEMLGELERLNDGFEARHGVRLGIRIGINTGEVLAPLGARPAGQFLVSGDPVNVAARLEQAAEPGTILVGERTWAAARNAFTFGDPVPLTVKGKREPVVARRLVEPVALEEQGPRLGSRMIGRDRELATLSGLLDEAAETELPRLVLVSGPAGIGKSRLLREFIAAAEGRHPELTVYRGRCLAAGHGITFWALGEILRAACRISLDEPADSAADKLRRTARERLSPLGLRDQDIEETVFALATSANLALAGNPLDGLAPEAVAEEMARAWPRFLTGLAAGGPTTVLIEDIHWADERMVRMLELLAARSRGRLLVVATARPEFLESAVGLAAGEDVTVVPLRPLNDSQSDSLVEDLLGESALPPALLLEIRQKADGNPFFLQEIVQRLIDEGALVNEEGHWRATEQATAVHLPDSIHALLAARIDGLPSGEKRLIQEAAVVGRVFWPGPLLGALDGAAAAESLRSLERRGLVGARPISTIVGEPEYIFRHVLIRDVAYASVPKTRRARAHAETGRWIEGLAGDRIEEYGELLAYHYGTAVAGEDADLAWANDPAQREATRRRAFEVLLRAGAAARHRLAVDKATQLHQQALALAADEAERARAHEALGDDHEALYHMDEAVAHYFTAVDSARSAGDDAEVVAGLAVSLARATQRWGAFREKPSVDRIRDLVKEGLGRAVGERTRAALLIARASVWRSRDDSFGTRDTMTLEQSIASVEEGLALARQLDDIDLLDWGWETLEARAYAAHDHGRYRESVEHRAELIDRLPSRQKVQILNSLAETRNDDGRFREGLEAAERAFELAAEVSPHERMHSSFALMDAATALGAWDRVLEVLAWHVNAASQEPEVACPAVRGGPPMGATVLAWRGEGKRASALVAAEDSVAVRATFVVRGLVARYATLVERPDVAAALADALSADPERGDVADGFEPFLETLDRLGRSDEIARHLPSVRRLVESAAVLGPVADRAEGKLALEGGRTGEARILLESALERFEELEMPFEAARTRDLLAQASEGAERDGYLNSALAAYARLGARPFAENVRAQLGNTAGLS